MNPLPSTPATADIPLRDIHLPDAISWWPPAIGWWLLAIFILLIAFGIYQFLKYKKQQRKYAYQKFALAEFKRIQTQFKNNETSVDFIRAISALLRRIALSYLPREHIASLTGEKWISQLNQLSSQHIFSESFCKLLETAPYQQHCEFDPQEIIRLCEQWIKSLPASRQSNEVHL